MLKLGEILRDKGSVYAVSGTPVDSREAALAALAELLRDKRYKKATHNSWAVILETEGQRSPIKADDGEAGAGALILRMQERAGLVNHMIIVTRWYGGVKLGGDRFRHVQEAVRLYLAALSA